MDSNSEKWLRRLSAGTRDRDAAMTELHALFVRVAHGEAERRRHVLPDPVLADLDDLCLQAADDALASVLAKLGDFRGRSRFTTWAIKFAIFETSVHLRRHPWRVRQVRLDDVESSELPDAGESTPQALLEYREFLAVLRRAVDDVLTGRQRAAFLAVNFTQVPIDEVAESLGSSRNAVHKTLHDARRKLRPALIEAGYGPG
jgi:RNA polymerase sigma-70 factor (ECF subfamily)